MSKIYIILVIWFVGCGQLKKGNDNSESSTIGNGHNNKTMALDSKDELPACEEANNKQLVYVIDEEQFYTCSEGEWAEIDIQGKDAEQLDDNHFLDKVTGYVWQIGISTSWGLANGCSGDWKWPDEGVLKEAVLHGLEAGGNSFWSSSEHSNGSHAYMVTATATASAQVKTNSYRAVCYRE